MGVAKVTGERPSFGLELLELISWDSFFPGFN
jgi:hypothetical protein